MGLCAVFDVPAVDSLLHAPFCLLDSHCVDLSALFPVLDLTSVKFRQTEKYPGYIRHVNCLGIMVLIHIEK